MTTPTTIIDAVCRTFGVSERELTGKRRHRNLANARFAAAHMLAVMANAGNDAIARRFHRSKAWASWAVLKAEELAECDKNYSRSCATAYYAAKGVAA